MSHAKQLFLGTLVVVVFMLPLSGVMTTTLRAGQNMTLAWDGGLIIDHTCIDLGSIPTTSGALCILDGNPPEDYITPDLYWESEDGIALTQGTLDDNPGITVSLWSWCTQLDYYGTEQVQSYLDTMTALEVANPGVTFVYMTGNAQSSGADGYNRYLNNEMIRAYCLENDKVLFDFADLDCWSDGEHSTYEYNDGSSTHTVPIEHEDFNGDEDAHTTYSSCEQKGRAFWWLAASLAGWNAPETSSSSTTSSTGTGTSTGTSTQTYLLGDNGLLVVTAGLVIVLVVVAVAYTKYLNK
jgi:hypothetical protein